MSYLRISIYDNRTGFTTRYAEARDDEEEDWIYEQLLDLFPPANSAIVNTTWIGRDLFTKFREVYPQGEVVFPGADHRKYFPQEAPVIGGFFDNQVVEVLEDEEDD